MLLESENKKSRHVLIAEGTGNRGESLVRAFTDRGPATNNRLYILAGSSAIDLYTTF